MMMVMMMMIMMMLMVMMQMMMMMMIICMSHVTSGRPCLMLPGARMPHVTQGEAKQRKDKQRQAEAHQIKL